MTKQEYQKQYREANKEKMKLYREANKEKIASVKKAYYEKTKDKWKVWQKEYNEIYYKDRRNKTKQN